ncbi:MAG: S46 family peptidase, partial [Balneolaceae bacterium]
MNGIDDTNVKLAIPIFSRMNIRSIIHFTAALVFPFFLITSCTGTQQAAVEAEEIIETYSEEYAASPAITLLPRYEPVTAGRFDNGRMWTFEYPPVTYFRETYNFDPDEEWFSHARISSVRLPNCSGSFVSSSGLVLTNHHCAREQITQVSRDDENLLDYGFYAPTLSDERHIEDYYVDQLIEVRDVTSMVMNVVDAAPLEERAMVRESVLRELEEDLSSTLENPDTDLVEVVSLYNGGRYSAYIYRRYSDVRLVMAPELQIGYFGGDDDNFTFPRYNLDMTFYRVYVGDKPLSTPIYFPFAETGVEAGDAVFLIGNPGSTSRLQTVTQLAYRSLHSDLYQYYLYSRAIKGLESYYEFDPDEGDTWDLRNFIFSLKNAQKFFGGQVEALRDPVLMGRRTYNDNSFHSQLAADPELSESYKPLLERLEAIQYEKIQYSKGYHVFLGVAPNLDFSSSVMQRAFMSFIYATYLEEGIPAELLGSFKEQIIGINDRPEEFDRFMLTQRFELIRDIYEDSGLMTLDIMEGKSAEEMADEIIAGTAFRNSEGTRDLLESDILNSGDPAIEILKFIAPEVLNSQEQYSELLAEEDEIMGELGRAWFAVYGTDIPPDATFSLRISDGVVSGYEYNGTIAPVYTTFFGLYDRAYSHYGDPQWALPERWKEPSATLDLSTPVNFVSTNDIIGGNSGSPVVNINLEVVGLAFDSNIEGMGSSDFILDDRAARAVS